MGALPVTVVTDMMLPGNMQSEDKTMASNAERQRAHRERMKASGLVRVTVWAARETAAVLGKMKPGEVDALLSGNGQAFQGNTLEAVKAVANAWRAKVDEAAAKAAEKGQQPPGQSSRWANAVAALEDLERALGGQNDG